MKDLPFIISLIGLSITVILIMITYLIDSTFISDKAFKLMIAAIVLFLISWITALVGTFLQ